MDSNKTPSEIIAELCVEAGISKVNWQEGWKLHHHKSHEY